MLREKLKIARNGPSLPFSLLFCNYFQILGVPLECGQGSYCVQDELKEHLETRKASPAAVKRLPLLLFPELVLLQELPAAIAARRQERSAVQDTHDVHEGQEVVLDMFFAVESDHRVVHPQQHLDVVVVVSRVAAAPQGLVELLLDVAVQGTQRSEASEEGLCKDSLPSVQP